MTSWHLCKYSMSKKLQQFKKRNRTRNAHLYQLDKVEGVDFVVCPMSQERLSMVKSSYIERVLGMSVQEYDNLYPGARGVSITRRNNIKKGLNKIDAESGKTKHQISQEKSREKLLEVDKHGTSGYKRKGQKTRATHMQNVDEFGRNGYSQLASKAIIKGNLTKTQKGLILDPRVRDDYYRYKMVVLYITRKFRQEITKGYKTGLAGTPGAYHIDHMFSIMNGYKNRVSPLVIGNKPNLKMIPWKDNLSKHGSCSILLEELLDKSNYTAEQSLEEYLYFINQIYNDIQDQKPSSGASLMENFYESKLCSK